jgi:hypothetical protein
MLNKEKTMKNSPTSWSCVTSNIGLQANSGVMEIFSGLGLLIIAVANIFEMNSGYFIAYFALMLLFIWLNNSAVKPRVKHNSALLPPNKVESVVANIFIVLAIIAGLYIIWLTMKGVDLNSRKLLFQAAIFTGVGIMAVSWASKIWRLIIYGQLVELLAILFISRAVSPQNILYLLAALGVITYFVGMYHFLHFIKVNPKS